MKMCKQFISAVNMHRAYIDKNGSFINIMVLLLYCVLNIMYIPYLRKKLCKIVYVRTSSNFLQF